MLGQQLTRFLAVGGLGFLVDAGVLSLLVGLGGDAYVMRIVSFTLAVSVTWWCNRRWTFRDQGPRRTRHEYLSYIAVQLFGAGINYAVYAAVLSLMAVNSGTVVLALACGSVVALAVNFCGARFIVFSARAA